MGQDRTMERYSIAYRFDGSDVRTAAIVIDGYDSENPRATTFMDIPYIIACSRTGSRDDARKVQIMSVTYLGRIGG